MKICQSARSIFVLSEAFLQQRFQFRDRPDDFIRLERLQFRQIDGFCPSGGINRYQHFPARRNVARHVADIDRFFRRMTERVQNVQQIFRLVGTNRRTGFYRIEKMFQTEFFQCNSKRFRSLGETLFLPYFSYRTTLVAPMFKNIQPYYLILVLLIR